MKVKREVRVCDICTNDNNETLNIGRFKCKICDRDLCEDCCSEYIIKFGDDDDYDDYEVNFDCCKNCRDKFTIKKKDKKFVKEIEATFIKYAKTKVLLKEIEK